MDLSILYSILRSSWTILGVTVFLGIIAWAFWPRRKTELERYGRIPLDDDRKE